MILVLGQQALACAVCGGASQNQQAFLETMVFMTLMPVFMLSCVAGIVWYLARRVAEVEAKQAAEESQAQV